ncbi:Bro-N domain-containing protein [Leuconostoc gasicomitatum]|uniref:BRO-N domain-containing protein n=1 Tax=Leuconostoc gasicomitatum TaxID=115778 RepID=UPI0007DEBCD4|nr:Bro-N domain-containing protein [Leuconostoc gasicomitatum]CUW11228.1 Phage antirepressor protein [Leuconostoc gasicomitatum]
MSEKSQSTQSFEYENQKIRTIEVDHENWFVGKDVATVLGYKDTVNAIKTHVSMDDKRGWQIATPSGTQEMVVINEPGIYAMIFGSQLDEAKKFKNWVTHEVLPALRQTGTYSLNGIQNNADSLAIYDKLVDLSDKAVAPDVKDQLILDAAAFLTGHKLNARESPFDYGQLTVVQHAIDRQPEFKDVDR